MDDFKIILQTIIDNSSLNDIQKQLASERLKATVDIDADIEKFAKSNKTIEDMMERLADKISIILGDAIDDKQATQWAKQYYKQMVDGAKELAKEQEKLNTLQQKQTLATQEKYYKKINQAEKERLNIKRKLINASGEERKILKSQYDKREKSIYRDNNYLDKHGLRNNNLTRKVSDTVARGSEEINSALAREIDNVDRNLNKLEQEWKEQGILVDNFVDKIDLLKQTLSNIKLGGVLNIDDNISGLNSAKGILEDLKTTSDIKIDGKNHIESALQQRVSAYKEILTLNERIDRLNPDTDSVQIEELKRQRTEQMKISQIAANTMDYYAKQVLSETELIDLAKRRGIALKQVANQVATSFAISDEQDFNKQQSKKKTVVGNIQYKLDTEYYSTQLNSITTQLSKFSSVSGKVFDEARISSQELQKTYSDLQKVMSNQSSTDDDRILAEEAYQKSLAKTLNLLKQLNSDSDNKIVQTNDTQRVNMISTLTKYLKANTAMAKDNKKVIEGWIATLSSSDDMTVGAIKNINNEFKKLDSTLRQTGQLGLSTADKLKNAWEKFGGWSIATGSLMTLYHHLTQMPQEVIKLDTQLVELSKVSDLTAEGLASVTKESYDLGEQVAKTGTDVLDSVTSFKRAGYSIADSMEYAEEALKTTNISENLKDAGEAASSLVNIMKGFGEESPEFARKINDSINQVSNTEAVDFDNLVDGATRLSAVADQAGMSFEQMLGTLTGGYEILGNMEKVATGQITIFSRLQAIQLDGEEEVSTVAKLEETFSNATKGAVHLVDETTGQLRNVYDILDDIAEVWDSLDKNTREALAIEAAGIRQKNVFLSMMQNWQGVEDAVKSASNAMGSAVEENQKYIESIEGRMAGMESAFQKFSQITISQDLLKDVVSFGTTFLDVLTQVIDKFGILTPLLGTAGIGAFIKNLDHQKVLKSA